MIITIYFMVNGLLSRATVHLRLFNRATVRFRRHGNRGTVNEIRT
jgi:hypothetical protein